MGEESRIVKDWERSEDLAMEFSIVRTEFWGYWDRNSFRLARAELERTGLRADESSLICLLFGCYININTAFPALNLGRSDISFCLCSIYLHFDICLTKLTIFLYF